MLYFENVSTFYGKIQALHDVNVEVRQGEIVTLIGANGAGKSTLLMTLCGNPQASSGSIRYQGEELIGMDTPEIMRKSIAVVPEGRRVFARLTVEENLEMGGFFGSKADNQEQLDKVLHLFPRLRERFAQRAGTMSGGEQQMPRHRPCADEQAHPCCCSMSRRWAWHRSSSSRSSTSSNSCARTGVTVFLVEQNANQALKLADRGYVLENGRIVMQGSGHELLNDPKVRDAYLGGLTTRVIKKPPLGAVFLLPSTKPGLAHFQLAADLSSPSA